MRVIFMGTPEFAVPSLRLLIERAAPGDLAQDRIEIVGVVTRVDKPSGRGRQVAHSPVKQLALEAGLPVFQPGPLRRAESLELLTALAPDLIVVAAFGQILPPDIIHLPPRGCLNVHASLLPRHRGRLAHRRRHPRWRRRDRRDDHAHGRGAGHRPNPHHARHAHRTRRNHRRVDRAIGRDRRGPASRDVATLARRRDYPERHRTTRAPR